MNTNIYFKSILEKNVFIDLKSVNNNLDNNILAILKDNFEGKRADRFYTTQYGKRAKQKEIFFFRI